MSYAKMAPPGNTDATPFNHFVVFDELNLIACHDFRVRMVLVLQPQGASFTRRN